MLVKLTFIEWISKMRKNIGNNANSGFADYTYRNLCVCILFGFYLNNAY
jgi:hypothetical protein